MIAGKYYLESPLTFSAASLNSGKNDLSCGAENAGFITLRCLACSPPAVDRFQVGHGVDTVYSFSTYLEYTE